MTDIILCGAAGRMGRAVAAAAAMYDCRIVAGVDRIPANAEFPIVTDIDEITIHADVILDFSHHTAVEKLIPYAKKMHIPLVVATTGHNEDELNSLNKLAKNVPVFLSRNMSLGVNLLISLCRNAASVLGENYDIEIIEKHHNKKLDAPSGTALMLAEAIKEVRTDSEYVYDRTKERHERDKKEIGIQAIRGGNIIGEHEVMFCGNNDVITISHSASSRELFAEGGLRAAAFLKTKQKGLYSMKELLLEASGKTAIGVK
ncbi:MAG TPA: 4-hydroxy-tetrahydrodipicolinate reductase [Clostridiales bacterium]|nr:MAG: 4-hydroxy-tetrahydrodipicolinate reductase [Candidatus Margulisbacteria bacterium GWF2_35_9]HAN20715.1 4-hydroxy-tetrahydrodipicolinate reductase [Clostridiales bacterium]